MEFSDDDLRDAAKRRVAALFGVEPHALVSGAAFGDALKATFVSDFRDNEFDQLSCDIRDVADRAILRELNTGVLVIRTVGDYCEHMVRCYRTRPNDVIHVLRLKGSGRDA